MIKYIAALVLLFTPLAAQEISPAMEEIQKKGLEKYHETEGKPDMDYYDQFMRMIYILGLIIFGLFLAMYLMKRMMQGKVEHLNVTNTIKVLEQRNLSAKSILYIIEVYDKHILVAESATEVTRLAEFPINEDKSSFQELMDS